MKMIHLIALVIAVVFSSVAAQAQSDYTIRTGDTLQIEVLEDASLNRSVVVLPGGQISFPFAGTLRASGRTIGQVQGNIRDAIASNFASPPTVFVGVQPRPRITTPSTPKEMPTIDIYLLGEVNEPGLIEVKPGTTFLQAMAISGGVSRFAAIKRIQLRRADPTTRRQRVTTLNYKALSNGAASNDIELRNGDVILVPERRLFE